MHSRDARNFTLNVAGEGFWGLYVALAAPATVLTVLLRDLGATAAVIGAIVAVESAGMLLPQILSNYIFASRRRRKAHIMLWHFVFILPAIAAMPMLIGLGGTLTPATMQWAVLGCFGLVMFSIGVPGPAWMDWIAHLFTRETRGTVMGVTWCVSAAVGTLGALAAGRLITVCPGLDGFFRIYLLAAGAATASVLVFLFIDDSPAKYAHDPPPTTTASLMADFGRSLRDANFRAFLIGRVLAVLGFSILPFIAVFYASPVGGGLTNGQVVSCGAAMTLGMAGSNLLLGRLGDKRGHRAGVLVGACMQVVTLALMLAWSGRVSCVAAYLCTGVCLSGGFISHQNILFETCPHGNRVAHITIGNLMTAGASIAAPLLAGLVAERWGVRSLFAGCLIFSGVAYVWLLLRTKEPRAWPEPAAVAAAGGASASDQGR